MRVLPVPAKTLMPLPSAGGGFCGGRAGSGVRYGVELDSLAYCSEGSHALLRRAAVLGCVWFEEDEGVGGILLAEGVGFVRGF